MPEPLSTNFLAQVYGRVQSNQPILMCLPAFPFKSPNTRTKVLGRLPDKAEEFALAHLDGLCAAIKHEYTPGAQLMIISDGLVYNDLLGVPDRDVWAYGESLRALAVEKGYSNIEFSRLKDLCRVQIKSDEKVDEIAYVANATTFRMALLNKFGQSDFDVKLKLSEDEDTCLTYRGYIKFLMTDLQDVYPLGPERSKSKFKRGIEQVAKQMLYRGDAFSRAVRENFPDRIRLSIHPSTGNNKISISPLPTDSHTFTTPWHSTLMVRLDGTVTSGHHSTFAADPKLELVHEHGRPSYYREIAHFVSADWARKVNYAPLYPSGVLIQPVAGLGTLSIQDIDAASVRAFAQVNSPVVLRGFTQTGNREAFVAKAHEFGTPTPWKFGLVLEVKDRGADARGLNNVLSAEWMPFHYDGLFKTVKRTLPDGQEGLRSLAPNFQLFTAVSPSPKDTGFTVFSSSIHIFKNLPRELPLESLRDRTWSVSTSAFENTVMSGLPLVVDHPTTGQPCLRFHEPWPQEKTAFDATEITIDAEHEIHTTANDSAFICDTLTSLMHDRRVAYYHSWHKGDLVISDNVLMMHTRSDFTGGCDRELWRIHFD
ncbi:L-tyrosine/L-tryptophan isonitrile synthase family protein [Microdochium nivale]|nr:L-tyrosine/L-tryptophan isonitrile synthase family protein [Microdochium nivale]